MATRVLAVSESGYDDALTRPPSARSIRHARLLDQIRDVHAASNGTYRARRVHAELTLGRGLVVGHNAVEMLMTRARIRGVTEPAAMAPSAPGSDREMNRPGSSGGS